MVVRGQQGRTTTGTASRAYAPRRGDDHLRVANLAFARTRTRNTLKTPGLRRNTGKFFLAAIHTVAPKPTYKANCCDLRHLPPKTLQKALYVGSFQVRQPPQVVGFGGSQFPFPKAPLAGFTPCATRRA